MQQDEIVRRLQPWRERHRRTAWSPIVREGDADTTASKFAGMPWLAADEPWPACGNCHEALTFFLQLDLAHLPRELDAVYGDGLVQLFYCTRCIHSGWEPFSSESLVRIVAPTVASQRVAPRQVEQFPPRTIVGWNAFDDYPNQQEHRLLGVRYVYDLETMRLRVECDDPPFVAEDVEANTLTEEMAVAASGDKLAGWPFWVQDVEYPACPTCSQSMRLVFQLDSEQHIPFMFGDCGVGHITQCAKHRQMVAFGWACY